MADSLVRRRPARALPGCAARPQPTWPVAGVGALPAVAAGPMVLLHRLPPAAAGRLRLSLHRIKPLLHLWGGGAGAGGAQGRSRQGGSTGG